MERAHAFRRERLIAALGVGVALQAVLLAFGIYASLWIGTLTDSPELYWMLNGVYMVVGVCVALLVVPWHRFAIRLLVAVLLVVPWAVWGWTRAGGCCAGFLAD